jgi:predicted site-specific integrase-resolvase
VALNLDDIDLVNDELTYAEAAEFAHVSIDAVYQWKARGYLTPCNKTGRPRFHPVDVARAEHRTRCAPQSRRVA